MRRTGRGGTASATGRRRPETRFPWEGLRHPELLDVRLCDLGLKLEGTPLEDRVRDLHTELARAGLSIRPHIWLSTDWFSPEGVPGFALPFYLAHPRLARLERQQMLEVEGGNLGWLRKLLRHEAGHALDHAYRLRRRKRWREIFGRASTPYRPTYVPDPGSSRHVFHLYNFYAQSHPVEDFAETFAVWLRPGSRWRRTYRGTGALKKLEYVDELMREIAGRPPPVRSRERPDSLPRLRMTLREYYERKREHYGEEDYEVYDDDLLYLFSDDPAHRRRKSAVSFLNERRRELVNLVAEWTGQHRFVVDDALKGMIHRCRVLGLRLAHSERESGEGAAVVLTVHAAHIWPVRHRELFR
jgi:hypothetical protein